MESIRGHGVKLMGRTETGAAVTLRPMTEEDWHMLLKWNQDPEVLYYSEGADVSGYSLEDVQGIYRSTSRTAFCFIIEADGKPVGECWLQKMNLDQIREKYPGEDSRRIDLMIGEKEYWGKGIGTEVIRLLTEFGFVEQEADIIFGCHIADYNPRSLNAFRKAGYQVVLTEEAEPGNKAKHYQFVAITKEDWSQARRGAPNDLGEIR